ncbi:hypothetical protein [Furfurilactobacillus entadae]|uniref:hypothetical protein n=1 Tax=Furfurilactobacillus entadae TaxID=2922307 RepID=UPI0035EE6E7F
MNEYVEEMNVHANGVVLDGLKSADQLTEEELNLLTMQYDKKMDDYATFRVMKNKHGRVLRVRAHDYSAQKQIENEAEKQAVSVLDQMAVAYGSKSQRRQALSKMRRSNKNVPSQKAVEAALTTIHGEGGVY